MNKALFYIITAFVFLGCNETLHYTAVLPCADCSGIQSDLKIDQHGFFTLREEYIGNENEVFLIRGSVMRHAPYISLKSDNNETVHFRRIGNNLIRLNDDLKEPESKLREYYIYKIVKNK